MTTNEKLYFLNVAGVGLHLFCIAHYIINGWSLFGCAHVVFLLMQTFSTYESLRALHAYPGARLGDTRTLKVTTESYSK